MHTSIQKVVDKDAARKRIEAFEKELEALSIKHGVTVDACGCCGSPWLVDQLTEHFEHYSPPELVIAKAHVEEQQARDLNNFIEHFKD